MEGERGENVEAAAKKRSVDAEATAPFASRSACASSANAFALRRSQGEKVDSFRGLGVVEEKVN